MMLIQVTLPHLSAGVTVENGRIIEAAPILAWSLGKSPQELAAWTVRKGGTIAVVKRWK